MDFEITPDNEPYLKARGKIILNACPGSGKTTSIAFKLSQLVEECQKNFGSYSGIACLSFTNVAKEEISSKYERIQKSKLDYPHVVSTIDSFVNQFITLPFYHLLNYPEKRPAILTTVNFLDKMYLGWFPNKKGQPLAVSYPPSKLKVEIDGSYTWDGHTPNPQIVDLATFTKYARTFKIWQLQNGYLNNDDSTSVAFHLLNKFPEIGKSLAKRFPYVIIDEAQDTSEIQYKIFDVLINSGLSNIEFVGDPYQSLYEFREARPDLFIERFADSKNWTALHLNDCRRSSQHIIDGYSIFRPLKELPIKSTCTFGTDYKVKVIRYNEANLPDLITKYQSLFSQSFSSTVLVRGTTHLEKFGVKQPVDNPWKNDFSKTLINAQYNYSIGNLKECVDELRILLVEFQSPEIELKKRIEERKKLKEDPLINIKLFEFLKGMPSLDDTLVNWTNVMTAYIKSEFGLVVDLQLKQKGKKFEAQNLKELMYPKVELLHPVSTIHRVKGMTFHSVLLVLSDNSAAEKISISDFVRPAAMPSEKQRMLYVALSRPEALACIAVPDSITEQQIEAQLGKEIEFVR